MGSIPKVLLVGSRGVGKTSLLQRWRRSAPGAFARWVDLDEEIERRSGLSVMEHFRQRGEAAFRDLEVKTLLELTAESSSCVIAAGAGLELEKVGASLRTQGVQVLWVRRRSDEWGRIFLDRPQLEAQTKPLDEFFKRHREREQWYRRWANRELWVPEGLQRSSSIESKILKGDWSDREGVWTWSTTADMPKSEGLVELRSDLWWSTCNRRSFEKALWTFRSREPLTQVTREIRNEDLIDWPLELGPLPGRTCRLLVRSLHARKLGESLESCLEKLNEAKGEHWKLAIDIRDWQELRLAHLWQQERPEARSFLPCSVAQPGRWSWYRLWQKGRQLLNFPRNGLHGSLDQPSLYEWLASPAQPASFAAVLGSPVSHSFSPLEHAEWAESKGLPFWAIDLTEEDFERAVPFLRTLGLKAAAVTSPLKFRASAELEPVNTLYWDAQGKIHRKNTDLEGLRRWLEPWKGKSAVIWGGGGTVQPLKEVLGAVPVFSSRTGQVREGTSTEAPEIFIWAAPPNAPTPAETSSRKWQPARIFDLNYREDSRAREWARVVGAVYESGEFLFREQARGQRDFWNSKWEATHGG